MPMFHVSMFLLIYQVHSGKCKNLFSFGNRLKANILRGMVADLLLESFRNTEISEGRY